MIGIIGGTGLSEFLTEHHVDVIHLESRFGKASAPVSIYQLDASKIAFLPRHGHPHRLPPHKINYRANLDVLAQAGVKEIVAVNAVGGICDAMGPAKLGLPDQILDYTYDREHTIYDGEQSLEHIDFTYPYCEALRDRLLKAARDSGISVLETGVYAATQGPRLESAAEIARLRRDGADMVGMTGMPEAALAREMGLAYACLALSVNWAAGLNASVITMQEIEQALAQGMGDVKRLLATFISAPETSAMAGD